MSPDFLLVLGVVFAVLSVPSILSALSDRRAPRASAITILIAGGLILFAIQAQPGGYRMAELPDVFARVIGQLMP